MKRLVLLLVLLFPLNFAAGQTVTIGTISKLTMCLGDTVWIPYTTTGSFNADNFFTVQLSNSSWLFSQFTNIGHTTGASDSIPIVVWGPGDQWIVRIIATDPYLVSTDTSPYIRVVGYPSPRPYPHLRVASQEPTAFIGDTIRFSDLSGESLGSKYLWTFGQDASIFVSIDTAPKVTYSSTGLKSANLTVSNSTGCTSTDSVELRILTCNPVIPKSVHIVTGTESGHFPNVWVKAGGNYSLDQYSNDTVFVESGASLQLGQESSGIYYLKTGSSFTVSNYAAYPTILLNKGHTITFYNGAAIDTLYCNNLQFDYSQVGGNGDVRIEEKPIQIVNTPNGLRVQCEGEVISASVANILGAKIFSKSDRDVLTLDLTALPEGVYFSEISSRGHQELRKIVVIH